MSGGCVCGGPPVRVDELVCSAMSVYGKEGSTTDKRAQNCRTVKLTLVIDTRAGILP